VVPRVMTQHRDRRRRRLVVVGREDAAAVGADAERREVGAGDVLRTERPRADIDALPPHADAPASGLERGDLFELRRVRDEALVERPREHAPFVLRAALDAAVVAAADSVET